MKAILKIEGREIEVEITEDQIAKLMRETPFKRVKSGCMYYFHNNCGQVCQKREEEDGVDAFRYAIANYCADKDLIQQQAYREILNRLLWRWQHENDEAIDWEDKNRAKSYIYCLFSDNRFYTGCDFSGKSQGTVYFSTKEKAEQAIKEVIKPFMAEHPDFVW